MIRHCQWQLASGQDCGKPAIEYFALPKSYKESRRYVCAQHWDQHQRTLKVIEDFELKHNYPRL